MDNVQNFDFCINIPLSQTYRRNMFGGLNMLDKGEFHRT
jgi:hypothetical protein